MSFRPKGKQTEGAVPIMAPLEVLTKFQVAFHWHRREGRRRGHRSQYRTWLGQTTGEGPAAKAEATRSARHRLCGE